MKKGDKISERLSETESGTNFATSITTKKNTSGIIEVICELKNGDKQQTKMCQTMENKTINDIER